MSKDCAVCCNFQRPRPRTQAIAAELDATDSNVISELLRLMQDERQLMDAEAELRLELLRADQERWPAMPMMTHFCALRYSTEALAPEVKNAEGDCPDWQSTLPPARSCGTCRHRRWGRGRSEAAATFAKMRQVGDLNAALNQGGDPGFAQYTASIHARMALEAAQAYGFGHSGASAPFFLAHCARYSTPTEHVVCSTRNLHERCPGWESANASLPRSAPVSLIEAVAKA